MVQKSNTPKRKRFSKQVRLNAATSWITTYDGKNIVSGYAKWFGVDKICAINELKLIGVVIPEMLENQIVKSHQVLIEQRRQKKAERKFVETIHLAIESDENFSYIVGYTSNGAPFGLTYEEFESIENEVKD